MKFLSDQRGIAHFIAPLLVVAVVAAIGTYLIVSSNAYSSKPFIDISSPQCGARMKQIPKQEYGIVGLNGTRMAFATNPCWKSQVKRFKSYDLYLGANYPSAHCSSKLTPYKCGQKAARYDLVKAKNHSPGAYWIDVESGPGIPWSTQANNLSYIKGMYDELRAKGKQVGIYSNAKFWDEITGGGRLEGSPAIWYAAGTKDNAPRFCGTGLAGGRVQIVQYVAKDRHGVDLDYNITC